MLQIKVSTGGEGFDDETSAFVPLAWFELEMEHSLAALSKWEAFFKRPFLGKGEKTPEEILWYFKAMTLTANVPPEIFDNLSEANVILINNYIVDPMTATWFSDNTSENSNRIVTSELIYAWMASLQIPFLCDQWHLNRLITLIRACNQLNAPKKKVSNREALEQQRELNERRKAQWATSG